MTDYEVDIPRLRAHARAVEEHAARVALARDAAVTTVDGEAFGVMCAFLALPSGMVCGTAALGLAALASELSRTAELVRSMAGNYQSVEDESAAHYRAAARDFSTSLGGTR